MVAPLSTFSPILPVPTRNRTGFRHQTAPFMMAMCLYWPKAEAFDGTWTAPAVKSVK